MVYICNAILEKMDLESCLEKVFAGFADTVFGGYSADIYIGRVEQFQYLAKRLSGSVDAFVTRVLFSVSVASLVESELFAYIWKQL